MTDVCTTMSSAADWSNRNKSKKKHFCDLSGCTKKLSLVDMHRVCQCSKRFCDQHRCFDSHNCNFVNHIEDEDKIILQMRCVRPKVEII